MKNTKLKLKKHVYYSIIDISDLTKYNQYMNINSHTLTLLYVDDENLNLLAVRALLRENFNILLADSIEEAFKIIESNKIHCIIADQRMPEMSGIDFLKIIQKEFPDIIRIILTGLIDDIDILNAVNNGIIHEYVTKPFNEEKLILRINELIK